MLTGLVLENFKTFGGAHAIPLAPLTLIYGANSSGKSSILQALLFLKQNIHLGNDSTATVVVSGSHVDLGSFSQVVHRHRMTSTVTVAPLIDLPAVGQWNSGPAGRLGAPNSRHAGFGFQMGCDISGDVRVLGRPVYWSLSPTPAFVWPAMERMIDVLLPHIGAVDLDSPYWSWLEEHQYLRRPKADPEFFRSYRNVLAHAQTSPVKITFPAEALRSLRFGIHQFLFDDYCQRNSVDQKKKTILFYINLLNDLFGARHLRHHESDAMQGELLFILNELMSRLDSELTFEDRVRDFIDFSRLVRRDLILHSNALTTRPMSSPDAWAGHRARHHSGGTSTDFYDDWLPHADTLPSGVWHDTLQYIEGITHIGPMRKLPARVGSTAGRLLKTVGNDGQWLESVLFANPSLVSQVNFWLSELEITHRVSVKMYDRAKSSGKVVIADAHTKATGSLHDVGFGVSQILPVIVELLLPGTGPVLVEQPELHLHPAAQVRLALLLNEARRRRQVIIETHSEHLLLGLQRLIQDGDAPASDVCVLRVSKLRTGSHVQRMEIGDDGNFEEPWLHGFFPDPVATRYGGAL